MGVTDRGRRLLIVLGAVVGLFALGLTWRSWVLEGRRADVPTATEERLPRVGPRDRFAGSSACRECHKEQHASWHRTYHRTMTQVASTESIVAPFDGVSLTSRGRRYDLSRDGDDYLVSLVDPDWEAGEGVAGTPQEVIDRQSDRHRVSRRIVMTTGSHHVQGYWISGFRGNLLRQLPWYYHIGEQRWIPREDAFLEPPGSPRHFMVWNDNCLACHSTGGRPGMNMMTLEVETEVAELGISCEACHGAGREHVAHHRKSGNTRGDREPGSVVSSSTGDPTIVNPSRLDHQAASRLSICVCSTRRWRDAASPSTGLTAIAGSAAASTWE